MLVQGAFCFSLCCWVATNELRMLHAMNSIHSRYLTRYWIMYSSYKVDGWPDSKLQRHSILSNKTWQRDIKQTVREESCSCHDTRDIIASWHGNVIRVTDPLSGESTSGFPSLRSSIDELWYFLLCTPKQKVVLLPVISNAKTLM